MSSDLATVPLTDLCAICHVNPIKYTCPRDGIHTCSLPCVKRHKLWAQCSGVRNPAEYRKRSELATAASIDKDFNFITKVERTLSRADDVTAGKGIDLAPARLRPHDVKPRLELEIEARGIKVIRAPKGLSRSKQNKTHWGGQTNSIIWTVEWVCEDGRKLFSGAPEEKSVKELFQAATGNKRSSRKRKRPSHSGGERRPDKITPGIALVEAEVVRPDIEGEVEMSNIKNQGPLTAASIPIIGQDSNDMNLGSNPESTLSSNPAEPYFYLHRPNTESRFKCLIPISSRTALQEVLHDRTLLEFPTIYIRTEPPDKLLPPFMTEEEYVKRCGVDIPINISIPEETALDDTDLEEGELADPAGDELDLSETNVLEVLAKDLNNQ